MSAQELKKSDHTQDERTVPKKKKTCLRKAFCIATVTVLLLVFGLLGVLSFDAGQRGLIRLADKWSDALSIEQIEGGLQQGLVLDNVRYQSAGIDIRIARTRLQWDFGCLLTGKICVEDLSVHSPTILIDTAQLPPSVLKEEKPSGPTEKLSLPVDIEVKNTALDNLRFQLDQTELTFDGFQTAIGLNKASGLTLAPTELKKLTVKTVRQAQSTEKASRTQASKPVDWTALEKSLTPAFLGDIQAVNLPFDIHLPSLSAQDWQYVVQNERGEEWQRITLSSWLFQADATGHALQLQKLAIDSSLGTLNAQGTLQLNGDFAIDLSLTSVLNPLKFQGQEILPKSQADLTLSGALKNTVVLALRTQGAFNAVLNGEVKPAEDKMPFHLDLTTSKGQYAFAPTLPPLKINDVSLKLSGDLLDYHAQLVGGAEGMAHIPHTHLELDADGKLYQVNINRLSLAAQGGSATLIGSADWKNGVQWQVQANLNKLNLRSYLPDFPAILSGELINSGSVTDDSWKVNLPTLDLTGVLSGRPLSLQGSVLLSDQTLLKVPALLLNYGDNRIQANGVLGEASDFALAIQAPNLRGLYGDLSGAVTGNLGIKGKLTAPSLTADMQVQNFHMQDIELAKGTLQADILSEPTVKGRLDFNAVLFRYANSVQLHQFALNISGDEQNHQIMLSSQGEPLAADFKISGIFDRTLQQWKGSLSQVNIDTPIGGIKPNQTVAVAYDNNKTQATVSAHCWQNADLDLCFPQTFTVGMNGDIPFNLKRLNLNLLNKFIQQETLKGQLRSEGRAVWFSDKPFMLNLALNGDNIAIAQQLDYRTFKLDIPKFTLNADIQNNNLILKSDIHVQNQGRINTDLKLNDLNGARSLDGLFSIERLNLAPANQLFGSDESVEGEIQSRLNLGGNLQKPLLHGNVDFRNLRSKLKSLPFVLTDGAVTLHFDGTHSTLQGHLRTQDSRLNIHGNADWANLADWRSEVRAETENFKLDLPSMGKLRFSANVLAKATPKLLELSGNIDIPWARIKVDTLPENAEAVSEDEVILNGPRKSKDELIKREFASTTKSGMEIRSDLKIKIGNDVNFDAYGFKSHLEGLLSVKQEKGRLGLYGQIDLKNGRYASFGQDLLISKGQVNFTGLASQPMLNIEAIRNPEAMEDSKITAGVKVVGVATNPEITVFSNPSKPQDQALSYLLTGRSLEDAGQAGSGGSVGAALLGMGLAKSGKLVGGIGEVFGIQDLNLGTAGVGDSSKVQVSGNIGKRLQVKYGIGLFDGLAEVTLRYRLLPQLYFQSVSGTNQVFDLLYQFEF